jgi:hypothetical protein
MGYIGREDAHGILERVVPEEGVHEEAPEVTVAFLDGQAVEPAALLDEALSGQPA